jgi:ADP-heptose:LPS heptosyltransferase
MKLNSKNISINYLVDQNTVFRFLINTTILTFFKLIRLINKIFANGEGQVLVISLNRLGDTVFTIPAITEIYKKFGNEIIIACLSDSVPIYKTVFDQIQYRELNRNDFYFGQRIAKSCVRQKLKKINPSLIIDITGTMVSASLIFNIRANQIIGTSGYQFRTIYDQFVEYRNIPKLTDIYLDAISPIIKVPNQKDTQEIKSINRDGKILIHTFAGWKEKEWNLKKFISLTRRLNVNYNCSFIIQQGQFSQDLLHEIENLNIEVTQTKSVSDLIECIKDCSLFIGNDSGPVNVAKFFGKPALTLYGATNPDFTETKQNHHLHLQTKLKCSAMNNEKFCAIGGMIYSCSGVQCMNLMTEEEVFNKLSPLLNEYCKKKSSTYS